MHRINKLFFSWLCITVTIVSLVACKGKSEPEKPRQNPPTTVDVIIAKTQPVDNTIEANGTVIANETVELRPEVSGRLTYLNVPEGKKVAQGTVLARINSADLVAQLQKSKAQLDLAEITVQRLKTLLDAGGVNQSDYDAAVNTTNNIKADMAYTQTLIAALIGLRLDWKKKQGAVILVNTRLSGSRDPACRPRARSLRRRSLRPRRPRAPREAGRSSSPTPSQPPRPTARWCAGREDRP